MSKLVNPVKCAVVQRMLPEALLYSSSLEELHLKAIHFMFNLLLMIFAAWMRGIYHNLA